MRLLGPTLFFALLCSISFVGLPAGTAQDQENDRDKISALIVDGQNNHAVWPKTTKMMKHYLEESGRFKVNVATTKPKGTDPDFKPDFSKYSVVISNFGHGAAPWPEATQKSFEEFIKNGGGLVVVHAADNSFPQWPAFNEMIGLGGWGGRNEKSGPYVYFDTAGKEVRDESKGRGGNHGPQHEFSVVVRDGQHPITKGLPSEFLHAKDELYQQLRGPAVNMKVLATSYADPKYSGTGRHEPMVMTIDYGKGRVFHTPMGHAEYSCECVGFISVFQRGTEWAATGKVTIPVPDDFPTADKARSRAFAEKEEPAAVDELRDRISDMLELLEGDDIEKALKNLVGEKAFQRFSQERDFNLDQVKTVGVPMFVKILKSLDVTKADIENNLATFAMQPQPLRFQKIDGVWYMME